jgi:hypothetical protein
LHIASQVAASAVVGKSVPFVPYTKFTLSINAEHVPAGTGGLGTGEGDGPGPGVGVQVVEPGSIPRPYEDKKALPILACGVERFLLFHMNVVICFIHAYTIIYIRSVISGTFGNLHVGYLQIVRVHVISAMRTYRSMDRY